MPSRQLIFHQYQLPSAACPTGVYCASGVRSSIAASLLRANGFGDVAYLLGSYGAWRDAT